MKKSIIALTVAAASLASVAQADGTTLYGSARFDYVYTDNADLGPVLVGTTGTGNSTSTAGDNGSRFGIMGSNDLGNGLTANYKFELGANAAVNGALRQRDVYANLAGGFGAVQIGTFTLPYDGVVGYTDIFNGVGGGYALRDAEQLGLPGRLSNVLAYVSPNWSGFQFTAGVVANGAGANQDHVDAYQLTAAYDNNGIHAALGCVKSKGPTSAADVDMINASLGYSNDMFMIGLSAEGVDLNGREPLFVNLAGSYNIDEANSIYASAGMYDNGVNGVKKAKSFGLGYQHNFSANTRVWAEYEYLDSGANDSAANVDASRNTISLGLRTDF